MYPFRFENLYQLNAHNIRIKELKKQESIAMSQPPRKVLHLPKVRMLSRGAQSSSGLRITNVKSVKPPNPELVKKQEEDRLRSQVKKEIVSRSRMCAFPEYECWNPVVSGRQHCFQHILREPDAPYVPCTHVGNDRCDQPAPRDREPPLCFEHARAALLARQRSAAPPPPILSTETLLTQLQHYVKLERPRTTSCASSVSVVSEPSEPEQATPLAVDPFKEMDAPTINSTYSASIVECGSESESDCETVTLGVGGDCRHTVQSSDTEDAPAEDSPLWRAGVFTAEEAVRETKTVLCSLQSAYIRQMDRLRQLLQTARLKYLRSLKQEKEQYCNINTQARSGALTSRERRQLKTLKAYASYHRPHGVHAVLARKLHNKRAKVNECQSSRPIPSAGRCIFTEGGVRCSAPVLPASKRCLKHILHDNQQVLFRPCGCSLGVSSCQEALPRIPLPAPACRYHTHPPQYTVFTIKKDDSGSEASHCSTPRRSETGSEHSNELTLPQDMTYS